MRRERAAVVEVEGRAGKAGVMQKSGSAPKSMASSIAEEAEEVGEESGGNDQSLQPKRRGCSLTPAQTNNKSVHLCAVTKQRKK